MKINVVEVPDRDNKKNEFSTSPRWKIIWWRIMVRRGLFRFPNLDERIRFLLKSHVFFAGFTQTSVSEARKSSKSVRWLYLFVLREVAKQWNKQ